MRRARSVLTFGIAAVLAGAVFAGPQEQNIGRADDSLNLTYQELMQALPAQDQPSLRKAQREWLKFRDATCAFETRLKPGDPQAVGGKQSASDPSCVYSLTRQRVM